MRSAASLVCTRIVFMSGYSAAKALQKVSISDKKNGSLFTNGIQVETFLRFDFAVSIISDSATIMIPPRSVRRKERQAPRRVPAFKRLEYFIILRQVCDLRGHQRTVDWQVQCAGCVCTPRKHPVCTPHTPCV